MHLPTHTPTHTKVFSYFLVIESSPQAGMSESYYESGPQCISQIVISLNTGPGNALVASDYRVIPLSVA